MPNSICDVFVELIMRAVPCIDRFYGDSLPEFAKKSCSGLCVIQRIEKSLRNERSPLPPALIWDWFCFARSAGNGVKDKAHRAHLRWRKALLLVQNPR